MTLKHKSYELEEAELLQEYKDGYITKAEYNSKLKEIRSYQKDSRVGDKKGFQLDTNEGDYDD